MNHRTLSPVGLPPFLFSERKRGLCQKNKKLRILSLASEHNYTGDVAIEDSGGSDNQYLYKQHHEGKYPKSNLKRFNLKWYIVAMWKF